jgi:hypothetical protein
MPLTNPLLILARPTDQKIKFLEERYGVAPELIEQAIAADPTENLYVEWILRQAKAKRLALPEDTTKLKESLAAFNKAKNSPKFKEEHSPDINRWIPAELYELFIEKNLLEETKSEKQIVKDVREEGAPGAQLVWKSGPWKLFKVTDAYQATVLGSGTSWCTTQLTTAQEYLSRGPLWIFYKEGKPWAQYQEDSEEFMDVDDNHLLEIDQIQSPELINLIQKCPIAAIVRLRKQLNPNPKFRPNNVVSALLQNFDVSEILKGVLYSGPFTQSQRSSAILMVSLLSGKRLEEALQNRLGTAHREVYDMWWDGSYVKVFSGWMIEIVNIMGYSNLECHWNDRRRVRDLILKQTFPKIKTNKEFLEVVEGADDNDGLRELIEKTNEFYSWLNFPAVVKWIEVSINEEVDDGDTLKWLGPYWKQYSWYNALREKFAKKFKSILLKANLLKDGDNWTIEPSVSHLGLDFSDKELQTILSNDSYSVTEVGRLLSRPSSLFLDYLFSMKNDSCSLVALLDYAKKFNLTVKLV